MITRTAIIISVWLGMLAPVQAQQVSAIYKIGNLLNRVNNSDTCYVVNFWATWCKPCVEELPGFDSATVLLKNKPVKVLLVCLNFSDEIKTKVNPFLKSKGVRSECILLDEINGNDFVNKVSDRWSGAIPATWFVKGEVRELSERKIKLSEILSRVETLLNK